MSPGKDFLFHKVASVLLEIGLSIAILGTGALLGYCIVYALLRP